MKSGYVYIITNAYKNVIYIGVTSNLKDRIYQHKCGEGSEFSKKYRLNRLVWFEEYPNIKDAIFREKQIKNWKRKWKINLIREFNPKLRDLYEEI